MITTPAPPKIAPAWSLDLGDGVAMTFQRIPPGRFRRGSRGYRPSEEPQRLISVPQAFFLGTVPVTQEQFALWTRAAGIEHKNDFSGEAELPAENLDWFQAMAFCRWINDTLKGSLPEGYFAILPDETRWEYACRAEDPNDGSLTGTEYHSGNGTAALNKAGWFSGNSESRTHPVGQRDPNRWGLYDMHGNVWEWCCDLWDERAYQRNSRVAPELTPELTLVKSGDEGWRVIRGGSWLDSAWGCRSAQRDGLHPGIRVRYQGCRVCLAPGSGGAAE